MKKKLLIFFVLSGLIFWGVNKYFSKSSSAQSDAIWVQATTVKEISVPLEARAIGTLIGQSVEITPETAGHVDKILFQDGTEVKKGDVLIQLDDAIFKAKYESSKAKLNYSENNFKRMTFLGKRGAIAKQVVDQAESDLKEKQADALENQVLLGKMKLIAPFDGVIGKCKVNSGDYVTVGQSLLTITNRKHLHIEYNVPEKFLPLIKLNQNVKIITADYPEKTFIGKLAYISPTINVETRSILLYAEISNEDNLLVPGMFVNILHLMGTTQHMLTIPARSLVPVLEGEQVYKIIDGKAYAVSVTLGKRTEDSVEVTQGLSQNDVVITDGQLKLKNGIPVKVKM